MTTIHFSVHHQPASSGVASEQKGLCVPTCWSKMTVGMATDVIPWAFRPLQVADLHLSAQRREAETASYGYSALANPYFAVWPGSIRSEA